MYIHNYKFYYLQCTYRTLGICVIITVYMLYARSRGEHHLILASYLVYPTTQAGDHSNMHDGFGVYSEERAYKTCRHAMTSHDTYMCPASSCLSSLS